MQRFLRVAALVVCSLACAIAQTNEWGETIDGLRLSLAVVSADGGDVQIRVTVNYEGEKPLLLPFAFITGERVSRHRLKLLISAADGEHTFSLDDPTIAIRGRFDPLVVPMVSHSSFVLKLPLAAWTRGRTNREELESVIHRNGLLWAELDCKYLGSTALPPLACPLYGYPNPNVITCWQGKLTSNKLRLPR
jgi:hypothetical protein